jgi:hypothetical protein
MPHLSRLTLILRSSLDNRELGQPFAVFERRDCRSLHRCSLVTFQSLFPELEDVCVHPEAPLVEARGFGMTAERGRQQSQMAFRACRERFIAATDVATCYPRNDGLASVRRTQRIHPAEVIVR